MLEIFRRNRFFNSMLLLPYVILVRIWGVFDVEIETWTTKGLLSGWLIPGEGMGQYLSIFLGILLVFLHAVMLNRIVIRNRMTQQMTLFPGLFYILIVSFFPSFDSVSSPLIGNTFLLLALDQLYASQKKSGSASRIFSAGFWLGTAFMCYFGFSVLFLWGLVGLSMLRTVKSREWLQYLFGYLTPIAMIGMLTYVLTGDIEAIRAHFDQAAFLDLGFDSGLMTYLQFAFFGLLFIIAMFNSASFTLKTNIHVQKKISMLYWLMFFVFSIVLVQSNVGQNEFVALGIPLGCFIAMLFIRSKQLLLLEIFHFALLLTIIGLNILYLI